MTPDGIRACSVCKVIKPPTEFNKNSRMHDGLRSYCRLCQANLKRAYLEKKEQEMNLSKYEAKKNGLNSQLRKVLDATPIQEAWNAVAISAEMRRVGSGGADPRATLGCLSNLVEQGLIDEVRKGQFKRVQPKEKQPTPEIKPVEVPTTHKEPEMQPKPTAAPASNPIDKLSKLASRLRDLASDMETAALELAEQAERNEHETAKMRQLQALLKSLG